MYISVYLRAIYFHWTRISRNCVAKYFRKIIY